MIALCRSQEHGRFQGAERNRPKADGRSAGQEILCLLRKPKVYCHLQKRQILSYHLQPLILYSTVLKQPELQSDRSPFIIPVECFFSMSCVRMFRQCDCSVDFDEICYGWFVMNCVGGI
ncbi:hypothetical protein L798_02674 [Zootermopsis nevadensis]|uniref:Uncharacterized protein n=1 Tax=Zootermopsis nevadensis TaxID=136037 RepID=A0A067QH66_ZOONE|nr:hypothetical protein L798_02674 [Zootermopsis nevadensis]